jgi:hypothetical protein
MLKEKADFAWRELILLTQKKNATALWRHGKLLYTNIKNFAKVKWTNQILYYKQN